MLKLITFCLISSSALVTYAAPLFHFGDKVKVTNQSDTVVFYKLQNATWTVVRFEYNKRCGLLYAVKVIQPDDTYHLKVCEADLKLRGIK